VGRTFYTIESVSVWSKPGPITIRAQGPRRLGQRLTGPAPRSGFVCTSGLCRTSQRIEASTGHEAACRGQADEGRADKEKVMSFRWFVESIGQPKYDVCVLEASEK
jgi:hypothetical protein